MRTDQKIQDVMPKASGQNGAKFLGVLSILLVIPTLLYMLFAKREDKKKEVYY